MATRHSSSTNGRWPCAGGTSSGDETYEWAEGYRRDYQKRFVTAAHRAAKLALECRHPKMAIQFYEEILQRDPIDEEAVRGITHCSAALGDTNVRDEPPRAW